MSINKIELLQNCIDLVDRRIDQYQEEMDMIKESMDANDVKTDYDEDNKGQLLGDFEKNAGFMNEAQETKKKLVQLDPDLRTESISFGSVVETNKNYYFVCAALGEIAMEDGSSIYAISTDAPIYKKMEGKKEGDSFSFREDKFEIRGIY